MELFNKIINYCESLPKNIRILAYTLMWSIGLTIVSFCIKTISLMWF